MDNIILFLFVWHLSHAAFLELSHEKRAPGRLGYIGDDKLPSYREYINHELRIPQLTNQDSMESVRDPGLENGGSPGLSPVYGTVIFQPSLCDRETQRVKDAQQKKPCLGVY